jgi:hypothetical protein
LVAVAGAAHFKDCGKLVIIANVIDIEF